MSEHGPEDAAPADSNQPGVGRHRAPEPGRPGRSSRLLAPLLAVVVVAAGIGVLVAVRGHSSGSSPGAGVIVAPPTPTSSVSSAASPSLTPSDTVTQTHPPPSPLPTPHKTHRHPPASTTAMAPVRVYNTTRISQLAHRVAAEIAAKGWTVPAVGNLGGVSSSTTLYYSPGKRAAALHLASEFSGIRRVRPDSEAQLDFHGLTLLITADWHD
ncbi:MAG TPA: LytR C-terminal domain-containing protein [Mycobacteriales bacterium]|nr:LytR C-terminal domain-containing protein [Mycobacteriales bacterium]